MRPKLKKLNNRLRDFLHSMYFSGPSFLGMLVFFIVPFGVVVYLSLIHI